MSAESVYLYCKSLESYKFDEDHPFNPLRLELTTDLLQAYSVLYPKEITSPPVASVEEIMNFHSPAYVDSVEKYQTKSLEELGHFGLGSEDNPVFPHMGEAARKIVGGTLFGARAIMEGEFKHALNLSGGLHHAHKDKASGFCIYNDIVLAIKFLLKEYNARVVYIDTDAHHGDGVQAAFYNDPNVLTISMHETGKYLFPGTGSVNELGEGLGFGFTVNVPMEPFTQDESWLNTFREVVIPLTRAFKPDIIISQNGCDAHHLDPLTHLSVTMESFATIPALVHDLAHELCEGRWLALGGGGYEPWQVVPRAWSLVWSKMTGRTLDSEIPLTWLTKWEAKSGFILPKTINDSWLQVLEIPRRREITEKNYLAGQRAVNSVSGIILGNLG